MINSESKVLDTTKDKSVKHTRYWTMTKDLPQEQCFEGTVDGRKPFQQLKHWAKENGYTHINNISQTFNKKDKIHKL